MKRRKKRVMIAIILSMALILSVVFIREKARPYICELAWMRGKELGSDAIGDAIVDVFGDQRLTYEDMADIKYSDDGSVVSVSLDASKLNYLRGRMSDALSSNIKAFSADASLQVPIGSLFGVLFSGRGFSLKLKLDSINTTDIDFSSTFLSAGINQTLHRIKMKITVEFTVLVASYKVKTVSTANFAVCETVIIGRVPEIYFGGEEKGPFINESV